jgi:DNA primase
LSDGKDGLLAHCFGGCSYDEILSALVEHGLLDGNDGSVSGHDIVEPELVDPSVRIAAARWVYNRLTPAAGTPAERYLRARGITLPVPPTLRFGDVPHRLGGMFPAMVAPIVDIDGVQIGIHATYLRPDGGGKADFPRSELQRECRGLVRGGGIHLAPHDPNRELIVAEGIETTLSAMQIFGLSGWSSVSAGGLRTLELPEMVRCILITADNDESGCSQRNAVKAARRWKDEGRAVRIWLPDIVGGDANDVLVKRKRASEIL